ncbi:MAG: glycerophosphodiester phosphodiesterase family protein [Pseudomonadota bacterium]
MTSTLTRRSFIRQSLIPCLAGGAALAAIAPAAWPAALPDSRRKVDIYGHRGACALRPEHTLASYAKAIADGADFIEPDLICTRDGVLVAAHEINITGVTDVARRAQFAGRRTSKTIDGIRSSGWFADDFTLAELKTLRRIEPMPLVRPSNMQYDGMFQILTWDEIIDFVAAESATSGRLIGLVPELKNSSYHGAAGLAMEERFLQSIEAHEYTRRAPLHIQSLEIANLKQLRKQLGAREHIKLMQLIDIDTQYPGDVLASRGDTTFAQMCSPEGLRQIAQYADIVAPSKRALIATESDGKLGAPSALIGHAHQAGMKVVTWTFRPENRYLPPALRSADGANARHDAGMLAELRRYIDAGIDGLFCDDPALALRALA